MLKLGKKWELDKHSVFFAPEVVVGKLSTYLISSKLSRFPLSSDDFVHFSSMNDFRELP